MRVLFEDCIEFNLHTEHTDNIDGQNARTLPTDCCTDSLTVLGDIDFDNCELTNAKCYNIYG